MLCGTGILIAVDDDVDGPPVTNGGGFDNFLRNSSELFIVSRQHLG
jgi:hypothetical protein